MLRFARAGVLAALALLLFAGAAAAAPSNDSPSSAIVLAGSSGDVAASNQDATFGDDEPSDSCFSDCATVWFAWDAPTSGTLDIGANADLAITHVSVYAETPSPDAVAIAADYAGVRLDVTGGTRYYVAVDTEWGTGDFIVDWTFGSASGPANDGWAFAQPISAASGSVAATTVGATAEADEPSGYGHSVWFHWVAPQDGVASFAVDGGQTVTAYSGWNLAELKPLGAAAPVAAGDVLSVRVDAATASPFTLSWHTAAAPAPTVNVPPAIVVDANAPQGRTVTFDASALDWKGRSIVVTCSKSSGYVFPVGTTTVTCSATDAGGRTTARSFDVRVKGVAEQVADLRSDVAAAQLDAKTTSRLTSQLDDVAKQLDAGRSSAVCGGLGDFAATVQKLAEKSIPAAQADSFVAAAYRIRAAQAGC